MLMNLHKKSWTYGLKLQRFEDHHKANETTIEVRIKQRGWKGVEEKEKGFFFCWVVTRLRL